MKGALVVARKELREIFASKALVLSMLSMPVVNVVVPTVTLSLIPADVARLPIDPHFASGLGLPLTTTMGVMLVEIFARSWLTLFLMMPVFLPIMLAANSVAGERERRTLEPLLAAPLSTREIVIGKSIAAATPGLVITWVTFLVFVPLFDAAAWRYTGGPRLPDVLWLFAMLVLAPLCALFGNGLAVLTSSLVADSRVAQNVAAMVTLPMIGIAVAQLVAVLDVSLLRLGSAAVAIAAADVMLFRLGVQAFDRERVLTRFG